MRLPSSWDRISRRLTSSEARMAVQSAEAEAVEQLEQYRHGRRIRPKTRMRCSWGRIGRRLTNSEATTAVESSRSRRLRCSWGHGGRRLTSSEATRAARSAEAEAVEQLALYWPKIDKQRGHERREVG